MVITVDREKEANGLGDCLVTELLQELPMESVCEQDSEESVEPQFCVWSS